MNAVLLLILMHPLALGQLEEDLPSAARENVPPNGPVRAGREALDHWWPRNYPWYAGFGTGCGVCGSDSGTFGRTGT